VSSLGTSCTSPLGSGTYVLLILTRKPIQSFTRAAAGDPFWMQSIKHQGIAAFNSDPTTYQVFRNVKDFGAKVRKHCLEV
jgi:hypothetical protein